MEGETNAKAKGKHWPGGQAQEIEGRLFLFPRVWRVRLGLGLDRLRRMAVPGSSSSYQIRRSDGHATIAPRRGCPCPRVHCAGRLIGGFFPCVFAVLCPESRMLLSKRIYDSDDLWMGCLYRVSRSSRSWANLGLAGGAEISAQGWDDRRFAARRRGFSSHKQLRLQSSRSRPMLDSAPRWLLFVSNGKRIRRRVLFLAV
jgi:hypothetical protein